MKKTGKTAKKNLQAALWSAAFALLIIAFLFILEALSSVELPKRGETALLYSTEESGNLTPLFLKAMGRAERSIDLFVYTLTDRAILAEMRRKAENGVAVSASYDRKASPKAKRRLGRKIRTIPYDGPGLMHRKALIIDDALVLLGSANMTEASLRLHGNLLLAFYSREAAEALKGDAPEQRPVAFSVAGQKMELWLLPEMGKEAVSRILQLIESAKKTLRVAMFTWTRQDFAEAVVRSRLRGVDVETALDRETAGGASRRIVKLLKKGAVPIYLNRGAGLLHHKFLYIDSKTLINGSANWTKAAFTQNRDCFIVLHELTKSQQQEMDALWERILENSNSI